MPAKNIKNTKVISKVILGLSGGVDSSVSAYLLQQEGYIVEAVFMKNWEEDDTDSYCSAAQDIKDAEAVCDKLNIKLHIVNFAAQYWDRVFNYFLEEYKQGRTPNPDVLCNKEIKFKAFLDYAINNLNADYIATGHYARINKNIHNNYQLLKAIDNNSNNYNNNNNNKDQSYFLHTLDQYQLSKSLFPIGELNKTEIRSIAKNLDLITHNKKDSTGICFIGEVKFKQFLNKYLPATPGDIIDQNNNIIGKHDGLMYYTIGQRQGLNLGGLKNYNELPWYVADKNLNNNTLMVVQGVDNSLLFKNSAEVINYNFIDPEFLSKLDNSDNPAPIQCYIKSRYRQPDQAASMSLVDNNKLKITFETPQRAITPGQAMVFYDKDNQEICLGGGTII